MYFSSSAGGMFHTWRQRFPDGQPEQITSGPTEEEGIAMAPDGHSFLTAVGVKQDSVWIHDARGDRQISLEGRAFQPKFTPDGTKLLYRIQTATGSELWVADLTSNRTEPLLPGFAIPATVDFGIAAWHSGYDISPDGREVVFCSRDGAGKLRLWLTPFDRRTPPRQIPDVEGQQPLFGPGAEIFFRKIEENSAFLYRVRKDGTGLQKASEFPLVNLFDAHPSHKWLVVGMQPHGEVIFPAAEGTPIFTHLPAPEWLRWSGDGKHLFVMSPNDKKPNVMVVPLSPGEVLPASFTRGKNFPSEEEMAKMPGVRSIPLAEVVPGPTADVYAFTRETAQRNLYRIPIQ